MNFDNMADPPIEEAAEIILADAQGLLNDLLTYDLTLKRLTREMAAVRGGMRSGAISPANAGVECDRIRAEADAALLRLLENHATED